MAIKWKSKLGIIGWLLLFTFGLSGLISGVIHADQYVQKVYFQTYPFQNQMQVFIDRLGMFELNYVPKEEVKKEITVTTDEINEHRYRYGNLTQQIEDITAQYEIKIQDAERSQNKEVKTIYISERDQKVQDIIENFKSDEHIRAKIIKEKEEQIDTHFRDIEKYRPEFENLKATFKYHLKDVATGKVYTNLPVGNATEVEGLMKDMLYVLDYPTAKNGYLTTWGVTLYSDKNATIDHSLVIGQGERAFEGQIAVTREASPILSSIVSKYYDYQQQRNFFILYTLGCIIVFILSLIIYKRTSVSQLMTTEKWQPWYNRIPIDVSLLSFVFSGCLTFVFLLNANSMDLYYDYIWTFIGETFWMLMITTFFMALTMIQAKLLLKRVTNRAGLKLEWHTSLMSKAYQGVRDAFAIRSMGTQVFIFLFIVFAFGLGATVAVVVAEPEIILLYGLLFLILGLPTIRIIVKRIGYFNRIVLYTEEMVRGNLESDLPIIGKSSLANLAGNINTLKYGVKTSQKEQAKGERLKTELITNVSHDLRTPLTSIITYTELLKTQDLTEKDREAYIEIIDHKSKRLKVLIDDLFEASKMASGSVELVKEKVDLGQLLQQALAEHNEAISQSTLSFRVSTPSQLVYAVVDGQKLWRVFDNIIGNILKYSLENTRVYISLKELQGRAEIVFKNVTKYELSEDTDELFERSKRGDTSRHTEGSGLGLAIAKSIIDLHEGQMDIEVDGDLFKVTVVIK